MNQSEIDKLCFEIKTLKEQLFLKEKELKETIQSNNTHKNHKWMNNELTNGEIERYSRQIILPNFGITSQAKLKKASVLIVGVGGLGK